ncbi:hypothetical protein ZIOFF_032337 [Zingiber officinale]|uniref:Uncharacterized protein n=1 Tax=Zingiber officinale TaxID=94328 RepID=A0A8J5GGA6_ZINOF|nr:hypothetical protein ZIOFF_032337 [Zingiber officinale]
MRERAVSLSLYGTLAHVNGAEDAPTGPPIGSTDLLHHPSVFLLLSFSATRNQAVHTHEDRAFVLQTSRGILEPRSLHIVNLGPAFRAQYGSFSSESPLPWMPCQRGFEDGNKREGESSNHLGQFAREQQMLELSAEDFSVERLGRLVGPVASQYTSELKDLYGRRLVKLESLARLVEESSAKILVQDVRMNFKAAMVGSSPASSDVGSEMMPLEAKAQANAQPMAGFLPDNSTGSLQITLHKLNGKNYLEWSQTELDLFEEEDWENPNDSARYKKKIERGRVFVFLAGLNKELDEVRGRIRGRKPLPPLREVFSEVRRDEARRYVMLKNIPESKPEMEGSALAVRGAEFEGNRQGKQRPWCDYCRKPWHTRESCWKLHGKPAYGKRKQGSDNKLGPSDLTGFRYTFPRLANEKMIPSCGPKVVVLEVLKTRQCLRHSFIEE